jgi:type II restriction enzyme
MRDIEQLSTAGIPVTSAPDATLRLSPGRHHRLQASLIQEFLPRFAPAALVLHLGGIGRKSLHVNHEALAALGVPVTRHHELPDAVLYDKDRGRLFLVEAVTSHGPVTPKRRTELEDMLRASEPVQVYVSAFLAFQEFAKHSASIAWETAVWMAEAPDHLVHYNGDRFLGPRSARP